MVFLDFTQFCRYFGFLGVLEPKFTICLFCPPKGQFLHSKNTALLTESVQRKITEKGKGRQTDKWFHLQACTPLRNLDFRDSFATLSADLPEETMSETFFSLSEGLETLVDGRLDHNSEVYT